MLFMSSSAWKKTASNLFIRVEVSQLSVSVVPLASESTGAGAPSLLPHELKGCGAITGEAAASTQFREPSPHHRPSSFGVLSQLMVNARVSANWPTVRSAQRADLHSTQRADLPSTPKT